MSLMACIVIARLTNYAANTLKTSLRASYVSTAKLSTSTPFCAPPNVVVYSSDNEGKYFKIRSLLERVFSADSLAIYPLTRETLLKPDAAWLNNVRGLVLDDCDRLSREEAASLLAYFRQGGQILDMGSNLCKHIGFGRGEGVVEQEAERPITELNGDIVVRPKGFFSTKIQTKSDDIAFKVVLTDKQRKALALEVAHRPSKGRALLSRIPFHLSSDDLKLDETSSAALYEKQTANRDSVVLDLLKRLEFVPVNYVSTRKPVATEEKSDNIFVFGKPASRVVKSLQSVDKFKGVRDGDDSSSPVFKSKDYFAELKTRYLGNTVIYQPVCETTMDIVKNARSHVDSKELGILAVCDRQNGGIGRAGNKWLSPPGCAMFTFGFAVDANSGLGKRLPLVQSIAALSCVTAIKELYSKGNGNKANDLDIRIKWPNDIYYDGKVKIGGILVHSTILGSTMHCSVGIGLNLSNEEPTMCLNRLFAANHVPAISREQLIASMLNNFEKYADAINSFNIKQVIDLYCNNWLHTDQRVVVREECQTDYCTVPLRRTSPPENVPPPSALRAGHVRRIDEFGYLVVEFPDRSLASLHPDGNSFDAMNGLILPKLTQPAYKEDTKDIPKLGDADFPRTKHVRGMVYQVR